MSQIPKNPFDREDWFSEVVKSNDSIMDSSKTAFLQFQTKYHPQSMTTFQKVLTFFTTHTITAVVTASICLGGIATFAAQTVAPEQYKPSTVVSNLFKNNKIQQTNPNTPLVSDAQNDVVSYNECGISIKYPKYLDGKTIGAFKDKPFGPEETDIISIGQIAKNQDGTSYLEINKIEPIIINCYIKGSNEIADVTQLIESKKIESRTLTNKELQEITGWFISANDRIKNITVEKNILDPSGFSPKIVTNILFEYENKFYQVNNSENLNLFSLNQIQIQFNNIANNIPNAEILKFDNVATGGFLFEYDKKLELKNKEKFEFSDPSKNNTFYVVNDKTLQDKISKLGLNNSDSIVFSGQVTNSNGKINLTKQEEFTITKIDKVEKLNNLVSNSITSSDVDTEINERVKFQAIRGFEGVPSYDFERLDKSIIRIGAFNLNSQNINPAEGQVYSFIGEIKKEEWFNNPEIQKTYNQNYKYPLNQVVWSPNTTKGFLFDNVEIKDGQTPKTQKVESAEVSYIDNGDGAILSIDGLRNGYFVDEKIKNQLSIAFDQPEGTKFLFSGDVIKTGNDNFLVDKITSFIIFGGGGPRIITNDSPVGVPDYNTIPARTGAAVPTKIIKDIDIRAGGVGLYQSYSDIYSNEEYIIKNEYVPGSDKMSEATAIWNMKLVEKNPNLRYGGSGGTYTFAGEVLDFGNNQYEIIKINKFEFKSIE